VLQGKRVAVMVHAGPEDIALVCEAATGPSRTGSVVGYLMVEVDKVMEKLVANAD